MIQKLKLGRMECSVLDAWILNNWSWITTSSVLLGIIDWMLGARRLYKMTLNSDADVLKCDN